MQPAGGSLTRTATWPVAQVLRQLLATQWWLAAAAVIVVASGCGARLGYVTDELVLQNDNGWATAAMLLSIPLLGALHVACVQAAARAPAHGTYLWAATRAWVWAFARLGLVALLLTAPLAIGLAAVGHAMWGTVALAQAALPVVAALLTFAPSILVTDTDRSAATATATSMAWALRREARSLVIISAAVTAAEVAVVDNGRYLGWGELPLRVVLAAVAVAMAAATASYTVAHANPEDVQWLRTAVMPAADRDYRAVAAAGAVAAAAAYAVLAAQPLVLARSSGGAGNNTSQSSYASVRNADSVPLTLTAYADSAPDVTLRAVGFTKVTRPVFGGPLPDNALSRTITLQPGQQANVMAEWTRVGCSGSGSGSGNGVDAQLHVWVISRIAGLTQRHELPTMSGSVGNCP